MSVVFLCVGAAKAGTSWLHAQLTRHPECHFRAIKELHYFNAVDRGRIGPELKKHRDQQKAILERVARSGKAPNEGQAKRLADRGAWIDVLERREEDIPAYLAYLHGGAREAAVVGEMTPAYALLSEDRLSAMARMAPDVRFLYLMRDPVERLWSHIRMMAGRRAPDGAVSVESCGYIFERVLAGEENEIAIRSDYASAMDKLTAAVPSGKLLFAVFEEMVKASGLDRICDFLDISRMAADPEPVYAGQDLEMSATQRARAAKWLAPQYAAAERRLGAMPEGWARGDMV